MNEDMEKLKIKDGKEDKNQTGTDNSKQRKTEMSRTYNKKKSNKQGKGRLKEIIGHGVLKSKNILQGVFI